MKHPRFKQVPILLGDEILIAGWLSEGMIRRKVTAIRTVYSDEGPPEIWMSVEGSAALVIKPENVLDHYPAKEK
jgi:hypothetical protein